MIIAQKKGEYMSQQHKKWIELVKQRLSEKGWSQSDLATVIGVTPAAINRLLKEGHGSDGQHEEEHRRAQERRLFQNHRKIPPKI